LGDMEQYFSIAKIGVAEQVDLTMIWDISWW
jgi:hypothetical protein